MPSLLLACASEFRDVGFFCSLLFLSVCVCLSVRLCLRAHARRESCQFVCVNDLWDVGFFAVV